tara:strand:- start:31 stop:1164 length:1134 start_codon:yes stop_codon:yes gene_type:complete
MSIEVKFNDLARQYKKIKNEVSKSFTDIHKRGDYINGNEVARFEKKLQQYLNVKYVITCGNGTDALQIAIMSLNLKQGDEVIIPAFSYVSVIEVVCILGLAPVLVDIDPLTFNLDPKKIEGALSSKTKLIIPVHLFGQNSDMESIMNIAKKNNIFVIEDVAQSINASITFSNKKKYNSGTIGNIGCFSFFPTKNLSCYGDGGAIITNNSSLAKKISMIKNHGQTKKYFHNMIGMNSRLDTLQAAILNIKLKYLNKENLRRKKNASIYNKKLPFIKGIIIPIKSNFSEHIYHQYTIRVKNKKRDLLKKRLSIKNISTFVYYPLPFHLQKAFQKLIRKVGTLNISTQLCKEVLSLPIHPWLTNSQINYVIKCIKEILDE